MSDDEKQARLAEALRANLRRRKAQSREQAARGPGGQPAGNSPDQRERTQDSNE
jgi:hypothetical protein